MKKGNALQVVLIVILCIVVVGATVGVIIYFEYGNKNKEKQENLLNREVLEMKNNKVVNDNIVTKGKYVEVEKLLKNYYKEYNSIPENLKQEYSDNKDFIDKCLQLDNITNDKPQFTKTKNVINKIKKAEKDAISKMEEMYSDDYIEEQADTLSSDYNKELFKSYLSNDTYLSNLESFISSYDSYLDGIKDVFDFLANNKDGWTLNNGNIMFSSQGLLDEFNSKIKIITMKENSVRSNYYFLGW